MMELANTSDEDLESKSLSEEDLTVIGGDTIVDDDGRFRTEVPNLYKTGGLR